MTTLEQHEIFEIEVLDKLKRNHLLQNLIFGGGTMLRLCYELDRYSVDLDFWFLKPIDFESFRIKMSTVLLADYELTDNQDKYYTQLYEIRSAKYPMRLKLELRKEIKTWDFQDRIAFSKFSHYQLGSILSAEKRKYYIENHFSYLAEKLQEEKI